MTLLFYLSTTEYFRPGRLKIFLLGALDLFEEALKCGNLIKDHVLHRGKEYRAKAKLINITGSES